MHEFKTPKKLIEVALPLDAINKAAAREKSIRHGHPSTLHLWWARRPLAVARAVIFAQVVNDPGYERHLGRGMNKEKAAAERERLFKIIEDLVQWDNSNNEEVLALAREAIWTSWRETCALNKNHPQATELFNPERLPAFHDPFAGGGAIPLEAQRLGFDAYASDLNPVAVSINKALIEIPPRFVNRSPVGPPLPDERQGNLAEDWRGARGLAEDVRRYGAWLRDEAEMRLRHLYPPVQITSAMANIWPELTPHIGQTFTVIAWLWTRTVKSPNPAYSHVHVPLATTFVLSTKTGREAFVAPVIQEDSYHFDVRVGIAPPGVEVGTKLARGANFRCLLSDTPIEPAHVYSEANAGRMGAQLMAMVIEGPRGRVYLPPTSEHERVAQLAKPEWKPELTMPDNPRWFSPPLYGLKAYGDLFTPRQLVALTTLCDSLPGAIARVRGDALSAGISDDGSGLDAGGSGATAYSEAVGLYLAFALDKATDRNTSLCAWETRMDRMRNTFGRQALPMIWDYAETNPFAGAAGDFYGTVFSLWEVLVQLNQTGFGRAEQADAQTQRISAGKVISTDPPYYDNIGYADLSDFFYVWLRKTVRPIYPTLFSTVAVPKSEELVATPYRHGSKEKAEDFFLDGMSRAMQNLAHQAHPAFPVTIYYAFKQSDTKSNSGTHSTGWETFLEAVLRAGFALCGTWPMRTELSNRMISSGTNALASSIVLVCRKRSLSASTISRREFIRELNATLPEALLDMTRGGVNSPVAPVDLSQAIIGPGMAIFSKYAAVLEADGKPMSVKTALQLINRFLAEDDFDHDTQFCLHWFETQGWSTGKFGEADVLARAKGTSVDGLRQAGVISSAKGELRLLRSAEMPKDWAPERDERTPIWEALHQMIRALNLDGESAAGALLARMPARAEPMRALAYRLYTLCERKGWAEEARAYNELVSAWSSIEQAAGQAGLLGSQAELEV
jgi:putative DNA methylase